VICDQCAQPIQPNHEHKFEDADRKTVATFCDDCCPRCWLGRREPAA
jgi:hypothetical protein